MSSGSSRSIDAASSSIGCRTRSGSPERSVCAGDLQRAAGVGRGHRLGAGGEQVVAPCARPSSARGARASAGCRRRPSRSRSPTRGLDQLQAGDRAQQRRAAARGRPGRGRGGRRRGRRRVQRDRVALRRAARARPAARRRRATFAAKPRRARPTRVVAQHVRVVLHRRAAAGGVRSTTSSKPSNASIVAFASSSAAASSPACSCSAPQQRGSRGACTSKPSAASTRDGRRVDVAEEHALDAALQEADASARARPAPA